MLLRDDDHGDGVLCIGQASHAWLSGQLARAWGNARFGAVEPREEVCLAAASHDVGMAEWDREPTLDAETGRPHSFMRLPRETHIALWGAAPGKLVTQSAHAALLVSLHGTALYGRRPDPEPLVRDFLAEQRAWQRRMAAALGEDPGRLRRNQRLLWAWDWLSLALCLRWAPDTLEDVPAAEGAVALELRPGGDGVHVLDPWPFAADEVEVRCEGRRLEGRCLSRDELLGALAAAPLVTLRFALRPS